MPSNLETSSQIFRMLAQLLSYPDESVYPHLLNGNFQNELASCMLKTTGEPWSLPVVNDKFIDFEVEYSRLFLVGDKGRPLLSLEAGNYDVLSKGTGRPEFMINYINWYKHFGLAIKSDDESLEFPDHLVCILEFIAWLNHLEAEAVENSSLQIGYRQAQKDFIEKECLKFSALLRGQAQAMAMKEDIMPFFVALFNIIHGSLESRLVEIEAKLASVIDTNTVSENKTDSKTVNLWG